MTWMQTDADVSPSTRKPDAFVITFCVAAAALHLLLLRPYTCRSITGKQH